ncbi:unnamed protein product, partial [Urochloa humidicola]
LAPVNHAAACLFLLLFLFLAPAAPPPISTPPIAISHAHSHQRGIRRRNSACPTGGAVHGGPRARSAGGAAPGGARPAGSAASRRILPGPRRGPVEDLERAAGGASRCRARLARPAARSAGDLELGRPASLSHLSRCHLRPLLPFSPHLQIPSIPSASAPGLHRRRRTNGVGEAHTAPAVAIYTHVADLLPDGRPFVWRLPLLSRRRVAEERRATSRYGGC